MRTLATSWKEKPRPETWATRTEKPEPWAEASRSPEPMEKEAVTDESSDRGLLQPRPSPRRLSSRRLKAILLPEVEADEWASIAVTSNLADVHLDVVLSCASHAGIEAQRIAKSIGVHL
jgi:hypothetical protein